MFHRWEYADQLTLLMWDWNEWCALKNDTETFDLGEGGN